MANTFTLISSTTVGAGGAASIDFTSIPNGGLYTDLQLVLSGRFTSTDTTSLIRFNGSTTGYTYRYLWGFGSTAESGTAYTGIANSASSFTANTFGNSVVYIPNYAGSTNKSVSVDGVTENNATTSLAAISALLWSNTAAITSISLVPTTGSFVQYSSASLYGVLKGSGGATVS